MSDPLLSRDHLDFLLFDWLQIDTGGDLDRETAAAILDLSTKLALDAFLPHYREADIIEPQLDADGVHILPAIGEALAQYAELGLFGASFPAELGGMGLPQSLALAVFGIFASANISSVGYAML